jgi:hypothetical protein
MVVSTVTLTNESGTQTSRQYGRFPLLPYRVPITFNKLVKRPFRPIIPSRQH